MRQTCPAGNLVYFGGMKKVIFVLALVAVLAAAGCKTHSGSREYIPGKGWVPND
jgi:hypothetical protein